MAEGDICLRIRFPSKMESLRCPADCTFGALKALIAQAGGVAEETLRCSHGFPPSALDLEDDAPIAGTLSNMDTLIVHAENDAGQAVAPAKGKGSKPPKAKAASSSASDSANVATLHGSGGSGSGASNGKKRAAGGGGGGKRRAVGALKLGSEDGIGESLASAVSSRKGLAALGKEDPAMAFFKAAAASALVHHQEEVLANDRFKATLAGNYEVQEVSTSRRADGSATEAAARFKVGRRWVDETFQLLSPPELRAVIQSVLDGFESDSTGRSLLNPFKMSLVSPRVYWNMVHLHGRDVAAGLRSLLPHVDWSFLGDRERRASGKAAVNAARAAEEAEEKKLRKDKRRERAAAKEGAARAPAAVGGEPEVGAGVAAAGQGEAGEVTGEVDDESDADDEAEPHDADGWEERGLKAMLREREYDFACSCLSRALALRIEAGGGEECAPHLARAWYLHGSALLRRAQAMKLLVSQENTGGSAAGQGAAGQGVASASLPEGWSEVGSAAVGRRVRRFYALHGACDGTVVAWLPPEQEGGSSAGGGGARNEPGGGSGAGGDEGGAGDGGDSAGGEEEVALWRVVHDDGDVEELEEEELDEALAAHQEDRSLAQEAELVLEAGWEALEMAIHLFPLVQGNEIQLAEAHERLADAALLNEQPPRALEELHKARALLHALRDGGSLPHDDRHLADVDFSLGIAQLQAGDAAAAAAHYRQAMRVLTLRQAKLRRRLVDAQIEKLSGEVDAPPGAAVADDAAEAVNAGLEAEVESIGEIIREIESRLGEIGAATTSQA